MLFTLDFIIIFIYVMLMFPRMPAMESGALAGEVVAGGQQLWVYLQEEGTLVECCRQLENQAPAGVGTADCGRMEMLSRQR